MIYIKSTVINKECLYKMGTFQKISRKADLFHLICCLKKCVSEHNILQILRRLSLSPPLKKNTLLIPT